MNDHALEEAPALVGVGIQVLVKEAKRLGLIWTIRIATIELGGAGSVTGIYDGDTVPIGLTNMTGKVLVAGMRVYVCMVPPSGNFVVGFVESVEAIVCFGTYTGISGFFAAETAILTTTSGTFVQGRAYKVEWIIDVEGSVANNFADLKIRRTDIVGTQWRTAGGYNMASVAGFGSTCAGFTVVAPTSTFADVLLLTLNSPMAGTIRAVAGANRLGIVKVTDVGGATNYPSATPV
jgi:hypothetical protein